MKKLKNNNNLTISLLKIKSVTIFFIFLIFQLIICGCVESNEIINSKNPNKTLKGFGIDPIEYGAIGDGITDDSNAMQKALSLCSIYGLTCKIPEGKNFLIKKPLFIWGSANLTGEGGNSCITFDVPEVMYLINVGISKQNMLEKPFDGTISGVTFKVKSGEGGRIIFFWRTDGAEILNNVFDVGSFPYSATSSNNDQNWVANGFNNCIRKNITIKGNIIKATATNHGSEGIGLGLFDGALVEGNKVEGVGDDPIGIHFCKNVQILNNDLKSVDGRIFVSNSKNVEIAYNRHERVPSQEAKKYFKGIALLYVGFEHYDGNNFAAPANLKIHHNTLVYPEGSIDHGSAIYIYAPRNVSVEYNRVVNNSKEVKATGFHLLPALFSGPWRDPEFADPPHVARVGDIAIKGNVMEGRYPLPMIMTGMCVDYKGEVRVTDNVAPDFKFYCPRVTLDGNMKIVP